MFKQLAVIACSAVLAVAALAGCSTISDALTRLEAPEKAAKAVDEYGTSVPYQARQDFRQQVNSLTENCDLFVYCVGDPDAPVTE